MFPLRSLSTGLFAGVLLSVARVPLGYEAFATPAIPATVSYGIRAAALLALAIAFVFARASFEGRRNPALLVLTGALLGFAAHARFRLESGGMGVGATCAAILILALAIALIGRRGSGEKVESGKVAFGFQRLGLAVCGAGLALAFEGVARHSRLLTAQAELDDSVLTLVLLAGLVIGAVISALTFRSELSRRIGLPVSGALAAVICCLSLRTLGLLASARGWDRFVREYGVIDYTRGHFMYDLVLGGVLFALPAVALGAALFCARRLDWSALTFGAAIGLFSIPAWIGNSQVLPIIRDNAPNSAAMIPTGAIVAAIGAWVFSIAIRGFTRLNRFACTAPTVACLVVALLVPQDALPIAAPWSRRPLLPSLVIDSPEGLLTVEPTGIGIERVTLDRRAVTPGAERAAADSLQLDTTFELLPEAIRERGNLRILLIGQLTPGRAFGLAKYSVKQVDRTAAWHESMPALEQHLFRNVPDKLPTGETLSLASAKKRLESASYDLIWIPAVAGEASDFKLETLDSLPRDTTVVAWLEAGRSSALRKFPARGVLVTDSATELAVAFVRSRDLKRLEALARGDLRLVEIGDPLSSYSVLDDLRLHMYERSGDEIAAFAARLLAANRGQATEGTLQAFAHFHSIQKPSSPWATEAEGTELDERTLQLLSDALLDSPPDRFAMQWTLAIAEVMIGKRRIDLLSRYVEPIAKAHRPWPKLELAIVNAEVEGLLFEQALSRLDRLASIEPDAIVLRARALVGLKREQEALTTLTEAYGEGGRIADQLRVPLAETMIRIHGEAAEASIPPGLSGNLLLAEQIHQLLGGDDGHGH